VVIKPYQTPSPILERPSKRRNTSRRAIDASELANETRIFAHDKLGEIDIRQESGVINA
jgi:hypothetical protein